MKPPIGQAWGCRECGGLVLGEGSWAINPDVLCGCADPQPEAPKEQANVLNFVKKKCAPQAS